MDCDSLTAVTQEKHLLLLCFDLLCGSFGCSFFFFFSLFPPSSVVVASFIGTMKANQAFEFFSFNHTFYYYYKPLLLHWAFAVLWSFS